MFKGILITKNDTGYQAQVQQIDDAVLPEGDVTVQVTWSTLNYKDGLAITGKSPVVRRFPMVPGIDFAGTVIESSNAAWKVGDKVILNGWGVGETHCGGLAEKARVKGEWLVPLPAAFSARQAMAIGTAGYTAMLCVLALEKHGIKPGDGEILVTGANGGVGSVAIALLAKLGYKVVASTGRPAEAEHLKALGASAVIDRAELSAPGKPVGKERWAGVVDTVGSHTLANACATTKWNEGTSFPIEAGHGCIGCSEPNFWDFGGFYKAISIPTGASGQNAVYAAAAGIAAGVAIGAMNKKSKADAASSHQTVTVEELNQESGS